MVTELIDPALPRSLPYRIYLPPCSERWRGQMPAIYLLHGLAYTDSQWDDLGIDEMADRLIRLGVAEPFLIVMPWERLGLDFEPTIIDHLLPHIESEYGASGDPAKRAIGGISRGAGWALRIGLAYADQFSAIGLHSPAFQGADLVNLPGWLEAGPAPALWIDIGERDPLRSSLMQLTEVLDALEVEYRFLMFTGEHAPGYWSQHLDEYLRWYVSNWN